METTNDPPNNEKENIGFKFWDSDWWEKMAAKVFESFKGEKKKEKVLYTKTYLEYRITKFFEKEKKFKKYWLDLYYNFNKEFSKILSTPFYLKMFYSNFNYITHCVMNAEWNEIMDIYKKVVKKNPNYKNSRLDDPKPIYDRRYILLITYYIFIIFIYIISALFYNQLSLNFSKIIKHLDIEDDFNSTFVVLVAYILFILGLYYGGLSFLYTTLVLLFKLLYYIGIILYYLIYYVGWLLIILLKLFGRLAYKTSSAMTGGSSGGKKSNKMKGGGLYEDFENFMNEARSIINELSIDLIVNVLNKFFENILPDEDTFETECKSTSNIEKMLAKQNTRRNTEESIDINKKINKEIKKLIPENIRKTDFARCMLKKDPPPPPPKCN
tara:strand:+ start:2999 stop:4147 length:1149 start_codon:yes stop_codon:yes gene_type:complete